MEVKIHERTNCEMVFSSTDLFALLRKAGYPIPNENEQRVHLYTSKRGNGIDYTIKLKWVKVVLINPKPKESFVL